MNYAAMETFLFGLGLALPRMLTMFSIVPLLSKRNLGGMVRAAIAVAVCIPAIPIVLPDPALTPAGIFDWLGIVVKEATIGLVLGYTVSVPFWAAEAFGFILDNQRGAGIAAMSNPATDDESSPLGIALQQAYLILFFVMAGPSLLFGMTYESYQSWPPLTWVPHWNEATAAHFLSLLDQLVGTAVVLAAPVMAAMLISELTLALASLFAPQLQVFFLAMPIKSGVALFVLMVYFSTLIEHWAPSLTRIKDVVPTLGRLLQ